MTASVAQASSESGQRSGQRVDREGPITLMYTLSELPSAQHRAGLAGMFLMVEWLHRQRYIRGICEIVHCSDVGLTLRIDREGIRGLFDELYAASKELQPAAQPRKNKAKEFIPPDKEELRPILDKQGRPSLDRNGQPKTRKVYFYPAIVPRAAMLVDLEPNQKDDGIWIKLWRNMVWGILRGVPATRTPFEEREAGNQTTDADDTFDDLLKPLQHSISLPSTYYLGAQASTAESVAWKDRARYQLLLHYWPYVAQIYVPRLLDAQKNEQRFVGYAVVVPDVAHLYSFCMAWQRMMRKRSDDRVAYRPRQAVVELAVESALDLAHRMNQQLAEIAGTAATADLVLGYEVYHMNKEGNNVRLLSIEKIDPELTQINQYARIKQACWDVIFRRQRLLNLLENRPWFHGFDMLAATLPHRTQFIGSQWFRRDAALHFAEERKRIMQTEHEPDSEVKPVAEHDQLAQLIYRLARNYVRFKVKSKYDLDWQREWTKQAGLSEKGREERQKYVERQKKVATEAFLAVRGRTGADFAEFLGGTLCSAPQAINAADFLRLGRALNNDAQRDVLRTLTLIALSAAAYTGIEAKPEPGMNDVEDPQESE